MSLTSKKELPPLPVIRVSVAHVDSVQQEVVLSIPRWTAYTVGLALRLASDLIESLAASGETWEVPKVVPGRGHSCVCLSMAGDDETCQLLASVARRRCAGAYRIQVLP